jgi:hypothetical protein
VVAAESVVVVPLGKALNPTLKPLYVTEPSETKTKSNISLSLYEEDIAVEQSLKNQKV